MMEYKFIKQKNCLNILINRKAISIEMECIKGIIKKVIIKTLVIIIIIIIENLKYNYQEIKIYKILIINFSNKDRRIIIILNKDLIKEKD